MALDGSRRPLITSLTNAGDSPCASAHAACDPDFLHACRNSARTCASEIFFMKHEYAY